MSETIVTIPATPSRNLSPNARSHWARKARDVKALREAAYYATCDVRPIVALPLPLTLHLTIAWEERRKRMDHDNAIASCKSAIDGIAQALGIDDKHMIVGTLTQERDPEGRGYLLCRIEPAQETPDA